MGGHGAEQDVKRAVAFYEVAAEGGFLPAIKYLAQLYDGGYRGLARDPVAALRWYRRAAELGDTESIGRVKFLELTGGSTRRSP
jgi:hypothetical protein